jgi:toxin ParE1/3/4
VTRSVRIRPEVEADLSGARDWYEDRRAGLGVEFGEAIDDAITEIIRRPLRFPVVRREVRRALTKKFPFGIFFLADEREIIVLAILHQARDPSVWGSRL